MNVSGFVTMNCIHHRNPITMKLLFHLNQLKHLWNRLSHLLLDLLGNMWSLLSVRYWLQKLSEMSHLFFLHHIFFFYFINLMFRHRLNTHKYVVRISNLPLSLQEFFSGRLYATSFILLIFSISFISPPIHEFILPSILSVKIIILIYFQKISAKHDKKKKLHYYAQKTILVISNTHCSISPIIVLKII